MLNKVQALKLKNWLKRNSIRINEDYYIKVLESYNFQIDKDYRITCNASGDYDINLKYNSKGYRIEVDEEKMTLKLFEEKMALNPKHKNRYWLVESFSGDEIIFDIINYIKRKGINKIVSNNN